MNCIFKSQYESFELPTLYLMPGSTNKLWNTYFFFLQFLSAADVGHFYLTCAKGNSTIFPLSRLTTFDFDEVTLPVNHDGR